MKEALDSFQNNIKRVYRLTDAYRLLVIHAPEQDFSDILRAQYVLTISTLDMFIHEIIQTGMMEILRGKRDKTDEYKKFTITMESVEFDENYDWFEKQLHRVLTKETYQNPYQIFQGIKFIFNDKAKTPNESKFWEIVANKLGKQRKEIIDLLHDITDRRNKIVHEADVKPMPTMPGVLFEIDEVAVSNTISFIEEIATCIYEVVTSDKN